MCTLDRARRARSFGQKKAHLGGLSCIHMYDGLSGGVDLHRLRTSLLMLFALELMVFPCAFSLASTAMLML